MNAEQLFPDYEGGFQEMLFEFTMFWSNIARDCLKYDAIVSSFGLCFNIIHLTVLTRKEMRTNSTNTMMIGLAISDIGLMIVCFSKYYSYYWDDGDYKCVGPRSYLMMNLLNFRKVMDGFFRRSSSWMAITMATIRTVTIRNALNTKFKILTTTKCGWICVSFALILSFCVSVLNWFAQYIVVVTEGKPWKPANYCEGFPANYSRNAFNFQINSIISPIYLLTNSITSKIIPCIAFPILTAVLISEFRKSLKQIKQASKGNSTNKDSERGERTTKLVIYTTVIFMIAELPQGVCAIINALELLNYGFIFWADSINEVFLVVGYINSSSHGIICYTMSSKYRKHFRAVFPFKSGKISGEKLSTSSFGSRGSKISVAQISKKSSVQKVHLR